MPQLGATELLIVLAIVVLLFGASKIPEIMRGMGTGIREFRNATKDGETQTGQSTAAGEPKSQLEEAKRDAV